MPLGRSLRNSQTISQIIMNTTTSYFKRVILIIVIFTQTYSASSGELPQQIQKLDEKRQKAISKINEVFVNELDKIKMNYTKAGDLENANLVADLIKQTMTDDSENGISRGGESDLGSLKDKVVGKWMVYDTKRPDVWRGIVTITADLTYSCQGSFGTDKETKGTVTIEKEKSKMLIGPYEFNIANISSGKIITRGGGVARTMERIR